MKYFYNFLWFLFIPVSLFGFAVRVSLDEQTKPLWELVSKKGFQFKDPKTGKKICLGATFHKLTIKNKSGCLFINGHKLLQEQIYIQPIDEHTAFENQLYDGFFVLKREKKNYHLINVIDSEEYIFSVLKTESWPTWPVEVHKVIAIAARSYVLHRIMESRKKGLPYHIKNTNHHQTYTGIHSGQAIRQAVQETKGLFLAYEGKPILAMFDICCGGVVPCHVDGMVDFKKAPYLARNYACTFCKDCKSYSWQVEYSLEEFRKYLQEGIDDVMHDLREVRVTHKDKAGIVKNMQAKTCKASHSFTSRELYKLLKEVKSFYFSVKKKAKKVVLKGNGFGHHMGLCQWGAREMVRLGWSFQTVLQFFYPGTTFMRLEDGKI